MALDFPFLADPLFWVAAIAAFAAALIRGFSGFGAGLVFMPVAAACFGPKTAAGVLFVIDTVLIRCAPMRWCSSTVVSGIGFAFGGIFSADVLARSGVLFPVYAAGLFIGSRMFGLASERTYRQVAYGSILFVAVASMPVLG